jgi:hypothetical protein
MGKRSAFERRKNDDYETPFAAVPPLIPYLEHIKTFASPCAGAGALVRHLESYGLVCTYQNDISRGFDARDYPPPAGCFDAIIENPPWSRDLLHPMILLFQEIAPTWLLFDADWPHTKQSKPFLDHCSHIVTIGRVKWIENSESTGKDNASWFRFDARHSGGPRFYGPAERAA